MSELFYSGRCKKNTVSIDSKYIHINEEKYPLAAITGVNGIGFDYKKNFGSLLASAVIYFFEIFIRIMSVLGLWIACIVFVVIVMVLLFGGGGSDTWYMAKIALEITVAAVVFLRYSHLLRKGIVYICCSHNYYLRVETSGGEWVILYGLPVRFIASVGMALNEKLRAGNQNC